MKILATIFALLMAQAVYAQDWAKSALEKISAAPRMGDDQA